MPVSHSSCDTMKILPFTLGLDWPIIRICMYVIRKIFYGKIYRRNGQEYTELQNFGPMRKKNTEEKYKDYPNVI